MTTKQPNAIWLQANVKNAKELQDLIVNQCINVKMNAHQFQKERNINVILHPINVTNARVVVFQDVLLIHNVILNVEAQAQLQQELTNATMTKAHVVNAMKESQIVNLILHAKETANHNHQLIHTNVIAQLVCVENVQLVTLDAHLKVNARTTAMHQHQPTNTNAIAPQEHVTSALLETQVVWP